MAELEFERKVALAGYSHNKPSLQHSRYDAIVERNGEYARVQIKSRSALTASGCVQVQLSSVQKGQRHTYSASEIDAFACYVGPFDRWFIIPVELMQGRPQSITFTPNLAQSPFSECCEAWDKLIPARAS